MESIEAGDASSSLICAGIYVRFKRSCGKYSCELVVGKSKLVPAAMTVPRAELYAAEVNSAMGQIVKRAYGDTIVKGYKITDSKITLHWINSWEKPLKMWTRNRVNEILRFSDLDEWYWVPSLEMPCDIGTRRSGTVKDVGNRSPWKEGLSWMKEDASEFPLKSLDEVKLEAVDKITYEKEIAVESKMYVVHSKYKDKQISEKIGERLKFSKYILHPSKYRFKCTVRIVGLVFRFLLKVSRNLTRSIFNTEHFPTVSDNKHVTEDEAMSGLRIQKVGTTHSNVLTDVKIHVVTLSKLEFDLV